MSMDGQRTRGRRKIAENFTSILLVPLIVNSSHPYGQLVTRYTHVVSTSDERRSGRPIYDLHPEYKNKFWSPIIDFLSRIL